MPRPALSSERASLLTSREYEHLHSTYNYLFSSLSLMQTNSLALTTLEGDKFVIQVTSEGWKVTEGGQAGERERMWEMVEDLLRSVSPLFKQGWDIMLLEKLQKLADVDDQEDPTLPKPETK